ncbi:MAG: sugar phosphate nucleotidyltransferase [Gammaproteobacteria bacterium]
MVAHASPKLIGIIPAAGQATRIAPLPCSKELYPVGFDQSKKRPKAACEFLLGQMRAAGAARAFIVIRDGKWDIPAYFGDGARLDMELGYLMMNAPHGAPYTVDQAYAFVGEAHVVFGFPDILIQPDDAFVRLAARQREGGAEIVLGVFPAAAPDKVDMVDVADDGSVRNIVIKPKTTELSHCWLIALWTPVFGAFMHDHLALRLEQIEASGAEIFVGDVIQAAIEDGIKVDSVAFDERYIDIGTPDDLVSAVREQFGDA